MQSKHSQTRFKKPLKWLLAIILFIYILYSSQLIIYNHQNCITLEEHKKLLENASTSTSTSTSELSLSVGDEQQGNTTKTNVDDDDNDERQGNTTKTGVDDDDNDSDANKVNPKETRLANVKHYDTELKHIVFGIAASAALWEKRKEYVKIWWRPEETRGIAWMDKRVRRRRGEALPEIRISGDTRKFRYTNRQGHRSAIRISRVVSEMLRLGLKDVRWFVMGDDDTVFVVENLVRILSKYNHEQFYYIGSSSESHLQNIYFSYSMAYGGGGFAISYPLAKELAKMQDRCIQRYPALYGSDDRMQACMAELGMPLTKEVGFHQYDVYGDLLGLLASHPVAPLVSLHHLDVVDPIFPDKTRVQGLHHLFTSVKLDPESIFQQSICYDKRRRWSISVSWGFVVQIWRGIMSPRELEMPARTFLNWYKRADYRAYAFNTRPVTKHPCAKPFAFYMNSTEYDETEKQTIGVYYRRKTRSPHCHWKMANPERISRITVFKQPDPHRWDKSPRRDCCRVLQSAEPSEMYISVGNCREGEFIEFHKS